MIFLDILFALSLNCIQELRVILFSEPGIILNYEQIYSVFVQEDFRLFFFPVFLILVIGSLGLFWIYSFDLNWREKLLDFVGKL
jgi:hypothetical protein